ncbi:MAG: hypothetical protein Q9170_001911 [Blastenia crenularia]
MTHLLAEGLLDRDHYYDWLLDAIDHSDLDVLSIYLLLVRQHLDELGKCRRFGRRLADSLLKQLYKIKHHSSPDLLNNLLIELADVVKFLLASSPVSFLLPKRWQEYESMLRPMIRASEPTLYTHFQDVCRRNNRLQTLAGSNPRSELVATQNLIKALHSLSSKTDFPSAALKLWKIAGNPEVVVHICIESYASVYSFGGAQPYLAARLLREWSNMGIDVENYILTFLANKADVCALEKSSFYRIAAELIQSRHFSVSRYLQWIIANEIQASNAQSPQESDLSPRASPRLRHDSMQFRVFLRVLEDVEDFNTMADLLVLYSTSHNYQLLADVAIITSHYVDIFIAMGLADMLFMRLFQQHAPFEGHSVTAPFTKALVDLGEILPDCSSESQYLQKCLQGYKPTPTVAACSPISEDMTEALQTDDSTSVSAYTDEVEQLLSSGNSMDKPLLTKVFELIWKRFEATWDDSMQSSLAMASLFSKLSPFDVSVVNSLMMLWIDHALALTSRPKLIRIGVPLICARSISFEQLLSRALRILRDRAGSEEHRKLLFEVVELLIAEKQKADFSINSLRYHFHAEQECFLRGFSPVMVSTLQQVLHHAHVAPRDSVLHIAKLLQDARFLSLLRTLQELDASNSEPLNSILSSIITLDGAAQTLACILSPVEDDVLSLPYRRLFLQAILIATSKSGEDAAYHLISMISDRVLTSSRSEVELWASLISSLPPEQREPIRDQAKADFFVLLSQTPEPPKHSYLKRLRCLLSIIGDADKDSPSAASATRILVQIHEKLTQLMPAPGSSKLRNGSRTESFDSIKFEESLTLTKLDALFRLLHTHQSAFNTQHVSDSAVKNLLISLSSLCINPVLNRHAHLSEQLYDLLIVVLDTVSPILVSDIFADLHPITRTPGSNLLRIQSLEDRQHNDHTLYGGGKRCQMLRR